MCNVSFDNNNRVLDHDHYNGKYRGATCQSCNTKEGKSSKIIPVFFHNGSNYDFHLFITKLMKKSTYYKKVTVFPKTTEEYISITYSSRFKKILFLDSYKFTQKSLSDLASSLEDSDYRIMKSVFGESYKYLTNKASYPYEYVSSLETLNDTRLPPCVLKPKKESLKNPNRQDKN